jgi:hypothetical protein
MSQEALESRIEELVDSSELVTALSVLEEGLASKPTDESLIMRIDLLIELNEFEDGRGAVLELPRSIPPIERARLWALVLYRMGSFHECLNFLAALPDSLRNSLQLVELGWYATVGRKLPRPGWLPGKKPEMLRFRDAWSKETPHVDARQTDFDRVLDFAHEAFAARNYGLLASYLAQAKSVGIRRHLILPLEARLLMHIGSADEVLSCLRAIRETVPCWRDSTWQSPSNEVSVIRKRARTPARREPARLASRRALRNPRAKAHR